MPFGWIKPADRSRTTELAKFDDTFGLKLLTVYLCHSHLPGCGLICGFERADVPELICTLLDAPLSSVAPHGSLFAHSWLASTETFLSIRLCLTIGATLNEGEISCAAQPIGSAGKLQIICVSTKLATSALISSFVQLKCHSQKDSFKSVQPVLNIISFLLPFIRLSTNIRITGPFGSLHGRLSLGAMGVQTKPTAG